jgi:hypothetical protein
MAALLEMLSVCTSKASKLSASDCSDSWEDGGAPGDAVRAFVDEPEHPPLAGTSKASKLSTSNASKLSALRSQGRAVCFDKIVAGLSDGMNMFASDATLARNPRSSPVANAR